MKHYDPMTPPNSQEWNELDELERVTLVEEYHRAAGEEAPNLKLHAMIHTVVENQIALGDETPVAGEFERLMSEGLDRHEALHAVGSAFAEYYFDMVRNQSTKTPEELTKEYYARVRAMTAEKWRASGSE